MAGIKEKETSKVNAESLNLQPIPIKQSVNMFTIPNNLIDIHNRISKQFDKSFYNFEASCSTISLTQRKYIILKTKQRLIMPNSFKTYLEELNKKDIYNFSLTC